MRVLSLFDGISCGMLALQKAGIPVDEYHAYEIEKNAIAISQRTFPGIMQHGSVIGADFKQYEGVDLLIGGSPCQSLSIVQSKTRQNLDGKSRLFYEFVRALEESKPKYFIFENVASMNKESKLTISIMLDCEPVFINSNVFVPQDRPRLYWTNIPVKTDNLQVCDLVLEDILEKHPEEKYFYNCGYDFHGLERPVCATLHINGHDILKRVQSPRFKSHTLTTCSGGNTQKKVMHGLRPRKLTPLEYERLQGLPDNYTSCVSTTARYNAIGNGWTVDVISYILSFIGDKK